MENKQKKTKAVATVLAFACLLAFCIYATAGSLQPSAPPGPTMKTLDEVEPRIPITQADIPLTITQKGSYYFTADLTAAATAITVEVNDVTIDLMGYSLTGPGTGTTYGIYMSKRSNVEIRNGTIRSFGCYGILEVNPEGSAHRVINVRVLANGLTGSFGGIRLGGKGHLVKDCTAAHNYGDGIFVDNGCTVTGNIAYNNQNHGINIDAGATVTGNTAYSNQGDGIHTPGACVITNNTAYANQVDGIYAGSTSTVTNNVASSNNQSDSSSNGGIRVYYGCIVKGNTLKNNKQNHIYVTRSDNAIEENLLTASPFDGNGIYFEQTGNFYANNRASGNGTDYAGSVPTGYGDGGGNVSF